MRKSDIIIKYATQDHAKEFYGENRKTFKGYAALLNGNVVGIGGLCFEKDKMVLFSDMKKEMRPYKKTIVKCIKILGKMVEQTKYPVVAIADKNEKMSERILIKLGFEPSGETVPLGKVFWRFPKWVQD